MMRFVIVNERLPRFVKKCCMCPALFESGYTRDLTTGLFYCDTICVEAHERSSQRLLEHRKKRA